MASTINSSIIFFTVLLACTVYIVEAQRQQVTLYDNFNQLGENLTIVATKVSNIYLYSFNGFAKSACFTGTWLFYQGFYKPGSSRAPMEYYFGNNSCINFFPKIDRVASLRYVGSPNDYRESSITFYSATNFQDFEARVDSDLPVFQWNGKNVSFVVTGDLNDSWTIYDQPNYEGNSHCVKPPTSFIPYQPYFVPDTTKLNIPLILFQSVRKGCFKKNSMNVNVEAIATRARGGN